MALNYRFGMLIANFRILKTATTLRTYRNIRSVIQYLVQAGSFSRSLNTFSVAFEDILFLDIRLPGIWASVKVDNWAPATLVTADFAHALGFCGPLGGFGFRQQRCDDLTLQRRIPESFGVVQAVALMRKLASQTRTGILNEQVAHCVAEFRGEKTQCGYAAHGRRQ
jgi:hypothetical protein